MSYSHNGVLGNHGINIAVFRVRQEKGWEITREYHMGQQELTQCTNFHSPSMPGQRAFPVLLHHKEESKASNMI